MLGLWPCRIELKNFSDCLTKCSEIPGRRRTGLFCKSGIVVLRAETYQQSRPICISGNLFSARANQCEILFHKPNKCAPHRYRRIEPNHRDRDGTRIFSFRIHRCNMGCRRSTLRWIFRSFGNCSEDIQPLSSIPRDNESTLGKTKL